MLRQMQRLSLHPFASSYANCFLQPVFQTLEWLPDSR